MNNTLWLLFFFFAVPGQLISQILPKDGAILNYRMIGFSFPREQPAKNYRIEIAEGHYNSEDSFKKNIIKTISETENRTIGEVPFFGTRYTWRLSLISNNSVEKKGKLYHFSTNLIPEVDSQLTSFRILQPAVKFKDAYVFLDGTRALYDMNGRPVWYLPNADTAINDHTQIRDLKLSCKNTITFLCGEPANQMAYEVNYNGDVLWKAPNDGNVNGESTEHYHHEFTRLNNGHYMLLGNEFVEWKMNMPSPDNNTADAKMPHDNSKGQAYKLPFGTVIEYDEHGNVVWYWKSSGYFKKTGINSYRMVNGHKIQAVDVHENSFFFDQAKRNIYISFKAINQVIKVKYPEGDVTGAYRGIANPGSSEIELDLFCEQHSCRISREGFLYLYDNNSCNSGSIFPKIVIMQEPKEGKGELKKIWEYECSIEGMTGLRPMGFGSTIGGNVTELPDGSMFVSMSNQYSKIFIVNRDKKILWSAIAEKKSITGDGREVVPQYRASIIKNKEELEQLIWNEQIDK